jgi:hypothetical protein
VYWYFFNGFIGDFFPEPDRAMPPGDGPGDGPDFGNDISMKC